MKAPVQPTAPVFPVVATLLLNSYAGRSEQVVRVIGQTPNRYRIQALGRTRMAGARRWIEQGQERLVPKFAIRFDESSDIRGSITNE